MKTPYVPEGCDQQGRQPEKADIYAPPFTADPLKELEDMNADVDKEVQILMRLILIALAVTCMIVIPAQLFLNK